AVDEAIVRIKAAGLGAKKLPVACAFHSPVVAGAREALARELAAIAVRDPQISVWSNVTAEPYGAGQVRELLAAQVAAPVRFAKGATWLVNGDAARPLNGEAPMKMRPVALAAAPHVIAPAAQPEPAFAAAAGGRDGVVIEYLRNMRSLITAQRDVMLSFLGTV